MPDIGSIYSGLFSGISGMFLNLLIYGLPIIVLSTILILKIRERLIYRYPVRLFRVRENGKVLEYNTKGGFIGRKNSAPFFRIKMGWFKNKDIIQTPKLDALDEQNRVYYKQTDVDTFIQLKRTFPNPEPQVDYNPVETDVKYGAILSVQRIKEALRTESMWKQIAPYFSMVLLFIAAIVLYWMLMKSCTGG